MKIKKMNAATVFSRWKYFAGVALPLFLLTGGCSKGDNGVGPASTVPLQSTVQAAVNLQSTAGFAVLAGVEIPAWFVCGSNLGP